MRAPNDMREFALAHTLHQFAETMRPHSSAIAWLEQTIPSFSIISATTAAGLPRCRAVPSAPAGSAWVCSSNAQCFFVQNRAGTDHWLIWRWVEWCVLMQTKADLAGIQHKRSLACALNFRSAREKGNFGNGWRFAYLSDWFLCGFIVTVQR